MVLALSVAALPITAVHPTRILGTEPATAALLTAAYGLGSLTGSRVFFASTLAARTEYAPGGRGQVFI